MKTLLTKHELITSIIFLGGASELQSWSKEALLNASLQRLPIQTPLHFGIDTMAQRFMLSFGNVHEAICAIPEEKTKCEVGTESLFMSRIKLEKLKKIPIH